MPAAQTTVAQTTTASTTAAAAQVAPATAARPGQEWPDELALDSVERAIEDIAAGARWSWSTTRPGERGRSDRRGREGHPEIIAFMMSECRGLICAPMEAEDLDRLGLPQMVAANSESMGTAFTVSVDATAAHGVTTGISAADRAATIALLADPDAEPGDFARPATSSRCGPARRRPRPRRAHRGRVDLARLAGLRPAATIVEIADEKGTMLRLPELVAFARRHGFAIISIEDLITYRRASEPTVAREAATRLPTAFGEFRAYGYRSLADGVEHIALVQGDLGDGEDVLVRVHSECLTGDVFGSQRCDCGPQLQASLERVTAAGRGVVLYLRGHEGRGIGLLSKLRAYELQELGHDTLDANLELGLPADARDYAAGAEILADLGVRSVRLMTNNPEKTAALVRHGLRVVGREPMPVQAGEHNLRYLRTKRDRMGHDLPWLDAEPVSACGNQ
ncbi:GTP cyclohydrolase II [Streptomyces sp. M19]